jgi:hypothetical protein
MTDRPAHFKSIIKIDNSSFKSWVNLSFI